jgi:signal transduction histidine kinase
MNEVLQEYGSARITLALTTGSLYVALSLSLLLILYDFAHGHLRIRLLIALCFVVYLGVTRVLAKRGRTLLANWLLISLYLTLAALMLFGWSINSPMGIITAAFAVLLPGLLMTPRLSLTVALLACLILVVSYTLHATGIISPMVYTAPPKPDILDTLAYITVLGIFALVSWLSARQLLLLLERARQAEKKVIKQKAQLAAQLETELGLLRQSQLQQLHQLYRFAVIGQSAAATLHELSNHLSILMLDFDTIKTQHKTSKSFMRMQADVNQITRVIRTMRADLITDSKDMKSFDIKRAIRSVVKDVLAEYPSSAIMITKTSTTPGASFKLNGNPSHLAQVLTILLHNAIDACALLPSTKIVISLHQEATHIHIKVSDNGPGIPEDIRHTLFQPHTSTKSSGLGVGLCIAKHLTESSLHGTIQLCDSKTGACFTLSIPREHA